MFRTSIVHLQERSYAVCCSLVCIDRSCCYEGEGRTVMNKINHQTLCILLDYRYIRKLFISSKCNLQFLFKKVPTLAWSRPREVETCSYIDIIKILLCSTFIFYSLCIIGRTTEFITLKFSHKSVSFRG